MNQNITLVAAFAAGFFSFVSPCVLPLIPGYISFVSGVSLEEMRGEAGARAASRAQVFLTSLAFVLGFSIVFVALGASATAVGKFLFSRLPLFSKIAGVLLIIVGLHTMGVFRLAFLETEKRVQAQRKPAGPLGAMLIGIAFAFGWTPCIGPILAGILVFRVVDDWFISAAEIRQPMLDQNATAEWTPPQYGKRMDDWLRNMDDWNISRRRYFGLPLPFYPCDCGHLNVIGSRAELEERAVRGLEGLEELHRPWIDEVVIRCDAVRGRGRADRGGRRRVARRRHRPLLDARLAEPSTGSSTATRPARRGA